MIIKQQSRPSYGQGYARNASECFYPYLWNGITNLYHTGLGPTGRTLYDLGPSKNHGSFEASALTWFIDPQLGYVIHFTNNELVQFERNIIFAEGQHWSATWWMRQDSSNRRGMPWGRDGTNGTFFWITTDNSGMGRYRNSDASFGDADWSVATAVRTSTNHYTLTADGADLTLYINGENYGTLTVSNSGGTAFDINCFGNGYINDSFTMLGIVGPLILHDRMLAQSEIDLFYRDPFAIIRRRIVVGKPFRSTAPPLPAGPVVFADMDTYLPGVNTSLGTQNVNMNPLNRAADESHQSAKADLGAIRAPFYSVKMSFEMAADPTAGGTFDLYWSSSHSATAAVGNTGGASGVNGRYTGYSTLTMEEGLNQMQYIGPLVVGAQNNVDGVQITNIGVFSPKSRYGCLVIHNNSDQSLHSDAVEFAVLFEPMIMEAQ